MHVEKELQELRERLAKIEEWKKRRDEIEKELAQVWVEGGAGEGDENVKGSILPPPAYAETEEVESVKEVPEKQNAKREEQAEKEEEDKAAPVTVEAEG